MTRLGSFDIDLSARTVRSGRTEVRLSPKSTAVLKILIDARGAVVMRQDLLDLVWPGVTVGEEVLTQAISELRRCFGDNRREPMFIQTVQKSGYRLLALPEAVPATQQDRGEKIQVESNAPLPLTVRAASIVVLPFATSGSEQGQIGMADGLSRDISMSLTQKRWLFVASRASGRVVSNQNRDPKHIATRIGVRYVLDGLFDVQSERCSLRVSLTDGLENREIWAERIETRTQDLPKIHDEINAAVVASVSAEIENRERHLALLKPIATLDAWEAYHRASYLLNRCRSEDLPEVKTCVERGLSVDSASTGLHSAKSLMHWFEALFDDGSNRTKSIDQCYHHAAESLALNARDSQGHLAMGRASRLTGDMGPAIAALRQSIVLAPSSVLGHYSLAYALLFQRQTKDGLEHLDMAERLSPFDPLSFGFHSLRSQFMSLEDRHEEAVFWSDRAVRTPGANANTIAVAAWVNELAGNGEIARELMTRAKAVDPAFGLASYLSNFPHPEADRSRIEPALVRLGL